MGSTNLLDVVIGEGAAVLELLAGEDQALLVRGNALLVLDLALHIVDGVRGLDLEGDGLARQGLNEAVAKSALVPVPSSRSHAQVVRCGVVCVFAIRWKGDSWARVRTSALFILSVIHSRNWRIAVDSIRALTLC